MQSTTTRQAPTASLPQRSMNPPDLPDPLFNLPPEVIPDPQPFIALCGLDFVHNATHRTIWECFASNRGADRLPILYQIVPADHEYPVSKIKKSYEYGTVPGGILKKNWIRKHMLEVPALVVLFADLEWDDPAFAEKKIACSSKIATVRASLAGRSTRIALVLVQSRPHTFAPGEPSPDSEKVNGLCNSCELTLKQVFFLPNNDQLMGYVIRLETALSEMVQQYYLNESKRVRGHRDAVMRMASQNLSLLVRHQFKIGYFNEFRQDKQTSLKHYQQAYLNLQQIRQDGGFEVKTVAMIIMYRICRLSFRLACPVDAISNFRKHLEVFRVYKGPLDLAYQHEAWLFRQNYIFGVIFDEAIQSGLSAIPSENPGVYFTKAADHMKLRQKNCLQFPPQQLSFVPTPPVDGEFYGQLILSVPSNSTEVPIAVYLQNCERAVNHTGWMIYLLNTAIAHFRKHRCNRTALMLFNRIGDEYSVIGAYDKAQALFSQGLAEYRKSKWSVIFSQLLLRQIRVSALIPNVAEFIRSTLEAICGESYLQQNDRLQLQETLMQILSGDRPDFRNLLRPQSQMAYQKWGSLPPEALLCVLDMDNVFSCVECHCSFDRPSFAAHEMITMTARLALTSPLPIPFSELQVVLSNPAYNSSCVVSGDTAHLNLVPDRVEEFKFQFQPLNEDVGRRISISKIILKMGTADKSSFILVWSHFGTTERPRQTHCAGFPFQLTGNESVPELQTSVDIIKRPPKVQVTAAAQELLLVGETFRLPIVVHNHEAALISNVQLHVACDDHGAVGKVTFASTGSAATFINDSTSPLSDIPPGESVDAAVLIRCIMGLKTRIRITLTYDLTEPSFQCAAETTILIQSVNPLQIKFMSRELHSEEYSSEKHVLPAGEDLIYFTVIRNASPVAIVLGAAELKFPEESVERVTVTPSYLTGVQLIEDEEAQDVWFLRIRAKCPPGSLIPMGPFVLTWNRRGSDQPSAMTFIPVPDLQVKSAHSPVKVYLTLPTQVTQFEPLNLAYGIVNSSEQLLDLHILLSTNDEYVLHGEKETHVRLGPHMDTVVHCSIVPINVGYMRLPEFEIQCGPDVDCREWIDAHLPKTVFVMPKNISSGDASVDRLMTTNVV
ncbi:Trafficking protein particle complex subunit 11 [Hypsibius exemplaris]|uniref:Trafficking protein particle complex subunit 11 n=1 Tax=Hypsibius exemplaris TaxID=2072580 RepID=A0A1W0WWJ0_HYPEX|nr:Trafficking protein particle complex subunit 11 [Hypsibius exemplaris]